MDGIQPHHFDFSRGSCKWKRLLKVIRLDDDINGIFLSFAKDFSFMSNIHT